jgi:hypothetical protein
LVNDLKAAPVVTISKSCTGGGHAASGDRFQPIDTHAGNADTDSALLLRRARLKRVEERAGCVDRKAIRKAEEMLIARDEDGALCFCQREQVVVAGIGRAARRRDRVRGNDSSLPKQGEELGGLIHEYSLAA